MRAGSGLAAVVVVVVGLNVWLATRSDDQSGTTGPVITLPEWNAIPAALVRGTLRLERACLLLGDQVVLWPSGSSWNQDDETVTVGDSTFAMGDFVSGSGGGYPFGPNYADPFGDEAYAAAKSCAQRVGANEYVVDFP